MVMAGFILHKLEEWVPSQSSTPAYRIEEKHDKKSSDSPLRVCKLQQ
jgi:hypothetical protein